jgi:hypothetical protein
MPISVPWHADHRFRDDSRSVDQDRRNGDHDASECFPQDEVTLDITVGKLFLLFELRETKRANQETVHA